MAEHPAAAATSDRDALLERLAEFAAATDARDWERLRSLFTPDAHGYRIDGGPGRIVADMRAHLGGVGPTQHLLGNHRVHVDGDEARTFTYVRVHHVGAGPKTGSFWECLGEYDDRWRRTEHGWLIRRRTFDVRISLGDFSVLRPE